MNTNTSMAVDLATITYAIDTFGISEMYYGNSQQQAFAGWYGLNSGHVQQLDDLVGLASDDPKKLNALLKKHGLPSSFNTLEGLGIVSILDMLVQWRAAGDVTPIISPDTQKSYPGFTLNPGNVDFYTVPGFTEPLACVHTKTGRCLWLMKSPRPNSELELAMTAQQLLAQRVFNTTERTGLSMPMLDMELSPDISWLDRLVVRHTDGKEYMVDKASQQFMLKLNELGAHVVARTSFGMVPTSLPEAYPIHVLDKPFLGFFTQPYSPLAIAAFWANFDAWKRPKGLRMEL